MDKPRNAITLRRVNKVERKNFRLLAGIVIALITVFAVVFFYPAKKSESGLKILDSFSQADNTFIYAGAAKHGSHTYQLDFYVSKNEIDPLNPLTVEVETKGHGDKKTLKSKLVEVSGDFYSVIVDHVPANQKLINIKLGTKKAMNGTLTSLGPVTLLISKHRKLSAGNPNSADLQNNYYQWMVGYYQRKVKKTKAKNVKLKSQISSLKQSVTKLEKSLDVQSGTQKKNTEQKITDIKADLKSNTSQIESNVSRIKKYEEAGRKYQEHV